MRVNLHPDQEAFIQQMVERGRYPTASEVVRESLRQFAQREGLDAVPSSDRPGAPPDGGEAQQTPVIEEEMQPATEPAP